MNDKINDGGPAFPCDLTPGEWRNPGMSLRAYFAGKAMQSIIGLMTEKDIARFTTTDEVRRRTAFAAVAQADALIKELEK